MRAFLPCRGRGFESLQPLGVRAVRDLSPLTLAVAVFGAAGALSRYGVDTLVERRSESASSRAPRSSSASAAASRSGSSSPPSSIAAAHLNGCAPVARFAGTSGREGAVRAGRATSAAAAAIGAAAAAAGSHCDAVPGRQRACGDRDRYVGELRVEAALRVRRLAVAPALALPTRRLQRCAAGASCLPTSPRKPKNASTSRSCFGVSRRETALRRTATSQWWASNAVNWTRARTL